MLDNRHTNQQPDGVFLREDRVTYVMVDLTCGYGYSREDLWEHEARKNRNYTELLEAQHTVKFFPLACTYNGALAEDTWRTFMTCLGLEDKAQHCVLQEAVKAICLGFSTMVDIRHGSFVT